MQIYQFQVGQLATNCYFMVSENEALIIDPGDDGEYLNEKILEYGLEPKAILLTHGHFDHVLAVPELKLAFNLPVYISRADLFLLQSARQNAFFWTKVDPQIDLPQPDGYLNRASVIDFGKDIISVITTPGHTPGSLSFYSKKHRMLLVGDLMFETGVGRTDFSYSSPNKLNQSLARILRLYDDLRIYPGHGENFLLKDWKLAPTADAEESLEITP